MASFNPFEIRNPLEGRTNNTTNFYNELRRDNHNQHEGSPLLRSEELSDEEVTRLLFKTKLRRMIRYTLLIKGAVLMVCSVAIVAVGWALFAPTSAVTELHRPHFLPTLLAVVDPETNNFVYALNNTLYERMLHSVEYVMEDPTEVHTQQQRKRLCKNQKCELPQIWLDKASISANDYNDNGGSSSVTLTWTMGRDGKHDNVVLQDSDVIALYCQDNDNPEGFLEAATIAQAKATSARNGGSTPGNTWYIPRFPTLRQDSCHFRLYLVTESNVKNWSNPKHLSTDTQWQYIHVASTEPFTIENARETPTAIHLAYSDTFSTMIVQFTTGTMSTDSVQAVPLVRFSEVISRSQPHITIASSDFEIAEGISDTYTASDMCQEPANQTEAGKFYPPGLLHTVEIHNLKASTAYQYQVGMSVNGSVSVWSEPSTFVTAPNDGDEKYSEFSYIVYGDQGCPETGCDDGKKWLSAMMKRESDVTSIHHFGDISYANGAAHMWDAWFEMIEPFSTKIPLMIAIGNHEYDHSAGGKVKDPSGVQTDDGYQPSWGNFLGNDSGGECGVPMAKRFRMPRSLKSNGVFWYSYNHGMVHTVVISSEHDLSVGSPQYRFLEHDLEQVNRSITPWVVLESHRPLYEGESGDHWMANNLVGDAMRDEIEDLLYVHNVDLVLAGHYHEYHRTCQGLYRSLCDSNGPVHITIGAAGAALDDFYASTTVYDKTWTARYLQGVYGYGKIEGNEKSLRFTFIRHGNIDDPMGGQILDSLIIPRRSLV
ncbi:metallophosphoesterase [Nitzschia inconspicua]|uniref:Metallophosphoesterase n=1 Tax=Nitzschia inconspicua TaxID=303405 RepID=A0A9K3PQ49_9STRA|nr:metallophosphoesterase [Nitzschia inconspicua]